MAEMVSMAELRSHARTAVIKFILAACDASKEPCWFSIPGHHDKSLRTLMRLSDKDYAATLLAAGLVSVTKFNKVGCSVNEWEKFLADGVIPNYNPVQRSSNCVEATHSKVNSNSFVPDPNQKSIKVVLLRIGKNADGEVSIASTMHNDDCEPPQRQSLRSAHSDLNTALVLL